MGQLAHCGLLGDGVGGREGARVVVATGSGCGVGARVALVGVGSGALGGVAEGCLVCRRGVVLVTVDPQVLPVEVNEDWDLH